MNQLVITVCATQSFCYAGKTLGRRLAANLLAAKWTDPGTAIIAGDDSEEVKDMAKHWRSALPKDWEVKILNVGREDKGVVLYKNASQIFLAKLRTAAFTEARKLNPRYTWSLDSDTLPHDNALRCMITMLEFDNGYYSISTCPYPNDLFLGGRGTRYNQIANDFTDEERVIPPELAKLRDDLFAEEKAHEAAVKTAALPEPKPEWIKLQEDFAKRREEIGKKLRECPPDGHIWQVIGKHGWRQRGWMDNAYPAIGVGAVVPSDWCGFGCTLLSARALSLSDWEGYDGGGTEDLWVIWNKWQPSGLRINVITHCPCDHVLAAKKRDPKGTVPTLVRSYHQPDGEDIGHLRTVKMPWNEL